MSHGCSWRSLEKLGLEHRIALDFAVVHVLEHEKGEDQARSKDRSDCDERELRVGCHLLLAEVLVLSCSSETGEVKQGLPASGLVVWNGFVGRQRKREKGRESHAEWNCKSKKAAERPCETAKARAPSVPHLPFPTQQNSHAEPTNM